jgi:hypothetical protein
MPQLFEGDSSGGGECGSAEKAAATGKGAGPRRARPPTGTEITGETLTCSLEPLLLSVLCQISSRDARGGGVQDFPGNPLRPNLRTLRVRKFGCADPQGNPGRRKTGQRPMRKSAAGASARSCQGTTRVERGNDHDGCDGCTRRSLRFAAVRSPEPKSLHGRFRRSEANGRERLPAFAMQKVVGRVPSSAPKS